MTSLRKYIKNQSELEKYLGTLTSFDGKELIKAENDIDKAMALFYEGVNMPFLFCSPPQIYSATLTSTQATITSDTTQNDGYLDYTVLGILNGVSKGLRLPIESQVGNVLTFFDEEAGLTGDVKIVISQVGKFPRAKDVIIEDNIYYKTIPEFIKECVALQYAYRIAEGDNLKNEQIQTGYTVNKDSYSENFDANTKKTIQDRISPEALDILNSMGLTTQSV